MSNWASRTRLSSSANCSAGVQPRAATRMNWPRNSGGGTESRSDGHNSRELGRGGRGLPVAPGYFAQCQTKAQDDGHEQQRVTFAERNGNPNGGQHEESAFHGDALKALERDGLGKGAGAQVDGDGADDADGVERGQPFHLIVNVEHEDGQNGGGDEGNPRDAKAVELEKGVGQFRRRAP